MQTSTPETETELETLLTEIKSDWEGIKKLPAALRAVEQQSAIPA
jgi:hypothetical protein